jgi:hypothetical protein
MHEIDQAGSLGLRLFNLRLPASAFERTGGGYVFAALNADN